LHKLHNELPETRERKECFFTEGTLNSSNTFFTVSKMYTQVPPFDSPPWAEYHITTLV